MEMACVLGYSPGRKH